ncbi:hypothetical protein HS99_0009300 [Kitasatospora aureofaciens]|uniref:Big-1 domain-containing protein n=1 Tax=Kitasatospora aureofaciens TaxID=1894 RepID=A0A1E7N1X6_KITAU|nr:hypothetical protein HS99_0009300 [Kitasatospora aureofaciens]
MAACSAFTATATGAPVGAVTAVFFYDGAAPQSLPVVAGAAGPATFTAVGSGAQLVLVTYLNAVAAVVGTDSGTVTVNAAPAGTISTTLSIGVGGLVTAQTTLTCSAGLTSVNGTLTYTLPGGGTVTAPVVNGVVGPASLGLALTAGQLVGVSFTPAAGTCAACTFAPITVTVPAPLACSVVVIQPVAPVVVGQPTVVSAVVLCNGVPVAGAAVTFNGDGAAPVTVTTNALGIASGSMTFPTAGPVSLTATVTAAGTTCTCTNVVSLPVTVTVTPPATCQVFLLPPVAPVVVGQPTVVSAVVLCNGVPVAGAAVTFNGGGAAPVTVTTNALGIASGSMTFPTAGPVSLTATVTAAGTTCTCTNVVSLPVPITVGVGGPAVSLQALPSCWQGHWEHAPATPSHGQPYPFTATLKAQLTPAAAGVTVNFLVAGQPVGSAVTDASGIAILTTDLNLLQVQSGAFTATATVGGTPLQSTGTLLPCRPL